MRRYKHCAQVEKIRPFIIWLRRQNYYLMKLSEVKSLFTPDAVADRYIQYLRDHPQGRPRKKLL